MKSLTGDSEGKQDGQDVMVPDFDHTAKEPLNLEIIEQVAKLVVDDHKVYTRKYKQMTSKKVLNSQMMGYMS